MLLASVMVEDRRTVLAAEIEALAVAGGRIVDPPERLEQLRVADLGRVEPDLDRLGVAGAVPADPLVGRVRDVPAGIPDSGLQHPVDLAEGRLDAPEASCGECRAPGSVWAVALERRGQRRADGGAAVPKRKQVMAPLCFLLTQGPRPGFLHGRRWGEAGPGALIPTGRTRSGTIQPMSLPSAGSGPCPLMSHARACTGHDCSRPAEASPRRAVPPFGAVSCAIGMPAEERPKDFSADVGLQPVAGFEGVEDAVTCVRDLEGIPGHGALL